MVLYKLRQHFFVMKIFLALGEDLTAIRQFKRLPRQWTWVRIRPLLQWFWGASGHRVKLQNLRATKTLGSY